MPPVLQGFLRDMVKLSTTGVPPELPAHVVVNKDTRFWFVTHWTGIQLLAQIFRRTLLLISDSCRAVAESIDVIIEADVVAYLYHHEYDERAEALGWFLLFFLSPLGLTLWFSVFIAVLTYDIAECIVCGGAQGVAILGYMVYKQLKAAFMPMIDLMLVIVSFPFVAMIAAFT